MTRLYRSRENRVIAGVCGGLAEYLDVDPVLVRLIAVLLLFVGGGSLIAYILGMIIIPDQSKVTAVGLESAPIPNPPSTPGMERAGQTGGLIVGSVLILLGLTFLLRKIPFFHQYYWWFWNMGWNFLWPSVLIAIGLLIILRAARNSQSG
jgi:phage shock protein PspC (stress-responsive transcriptional regulator)